MKYHFKVLMGDDGRFVVQSVEFFRCANSVARVEDAEAEAKRLLDAHLNQPTFDMFYSAPAEGTTTEIQNRFGHRAVKFFAVPVSPATAFATTLRRLRAHRCLSQADAANLLGIKSRSAYQRLEDPLRSNPTLKMIARLAEVYPKLDVGSFFEPSHKSDRNRSNSVPSPRERHI
jgi:DNA-binding XRE family transcriptional regulator